VNKRKLTQASAALSPTLTFAKSAANDGTIHHDREVSLTIDYGHRELINRIDPPIANDCDERHSMFKKIVCGLERSHPRGRGDLYYPFGGARLALHDED
jgi:hypothetical protein